MKQWQSIMDIATIFHYHYHEQQKQPVILSLIQSIDMTMEYS